MVELPSEFELSLRVLLAFLLGGLVGLEREIRDQPAGLRTHITVALGACLFGIVSAYGFGEFIGRRASTNYQVDVTRIASQIVVGVGFLGGGAILKQGATVKGLTTAASLWVTAAIGLGVAMGAYVVTLTTTVVLLIALATLRVPRRWIRDRLIRARETLLVHVKKEGDPASVLAALSQLPGLSVHAILVQERHDGYIVEAEVRGAPGENIETLVTPLVDRDDVDDIEFS